MKYALLLLALTFLSLSAQPYRCDWSVSGIGGGDMSGGNIRSSVTAGQTAIGRLTGTNLFALIGFWQPDVQVGIAEEQESVVGVGLKTSLARLPNPSRLPLRLAYSLAQKADVRLEIFDLTGRLIARPVNSFQNPGRYSVLWNGRDTKGRKLPCGVYFLRFRAGEHQEKRKLIIH
ncbi:T9SS type A sorting domain-containing protein [candidate division WOR-3 bacterium]|nr:T9SS type A sorting domain-containing protein [candidate division WOR-3 bacterium]